MTDLRAEGASLDSCQPTPFPGLRNALGGFVAGEVARQGQRSSCQGSGDPSSAPHPLGDSRVSERCLGVDEGARNLLRLFCTTGHGSPVCIRDVLAHHAWRTQLGPSFLSTNLSPGGRQVESVYELWPRSCRLEPGESSQVSNVSRFVPIPAKMRRALIAEEVRDQRAEHIAAQGRGDADDDHLDHAAHEIEVGEVALDDADSHQGEQCQHQRER
jgi:hypothetical protein